MSPRTLILLGAFLLPTALASCAAPDGADDVGLSTEEPREAPGLTLVPQHSDDDALVLHVDFASTQSASPRVAEIWVAHADGIVFESAEAGDSLTRAEKQLVAQERDGRVRLVVFSAGNTNSIESGTIAELRFRRNGAARARFEILSESPIFAPAKANQGLVIGAPVEL
jgi:hypothetical protein